MDIGMETRVEAKSVAWLIEIAAEANQWDDQKTLRLALDELAGLLVRPQVRAFAVQ